MSMSCPVCYESYELDSDTLRPRRLDCGDIICSGCVSSEFVDDAFFCPECGQEHHGASVDDFSALLSDVPGLGGGEGSFPSGDHEDEEEEQDTFGNFSANGPLVSPRTSRSICTFPGCKNKALANGECLIHSKHRHKSVCEVDQIAKNMANTKLNFSSSNKLQQVDNSRDIAPDDLLHRFREQGRLELGEALELIDHAKEIMFREPNILNLDAPIITVGDIHGQFYDLLNLFEEGGKPGMQEKYLFLGDYVDRGSFSCEVMFYLLALKIMFPDKVYLLRGNHECASVSGHFGFKEECKMKYGVNVYYRFLLLFQTMPLAAVISTAYGDIFACHGGLSPSFQTLDEINNIYRFVEPEADPALLDIVWSDPVSEEEVLSMGDDEYEAFMSIDWKSNPARGCSYSFGYKALREFLNKNSLVCIVRAHEVQEEGFKKHFDPAEVEARIKRLMKRRIESDSGTSLVLLGELDFPPLITIFSAPNYCDRYQNKAAILRIDMALDDFRVIQYDCVEHPMPEIQESQTDNYILAIIAACPYMPTSFRNFVRKAIELGPEANQNLVENEDIPAANESNESLPGETPQVVDISSCETDGDQITPADGVPPLNVPIEELKTGEGNIISTPSTPVRISHRSASLPAAFLEASPASSMRHLARRESESDAQSVAAPDEMAIEKFLLAHPVPSKLMRKPSLRGPDGLGLSTPTGVDETPRSRQRSGYMGSSSRHKKRESVVISLVRCNLGSSDEEDDDIEATVVGPLNEFSSDDEGDSAAKRRNKETSEKESVRAEEVSASITIRNKTTSARSQVGVDMIMEGQVLFESPSAHLNPDDSTVSMHTTTSVINKSSLSSIFSAIEATLGNEVPETTESGDEAEEEKISTPVTSNFSEKPNSTSDLTQRKASSPRHSENAPVRKGSLTKEKDPIAASATSISMKRMPKRGSLTYCKSEAYLEAMASDSINEIHPEKLVGLMFKGATDTNGAIATEREKNITLFKLARVEVPLNSVADLKKRFEKKSIDEQSRRDDPARRPAPISSAATSLAREFWKQKQSPVTDVTPLDRKLEVDALAKTSRVASLQAKFGGSVKSQTRLSLTRDESDTLHEGVSADSHPTVESRPVSLPVTRSTETEIHVQIQRYSNMHPDGSHSNPNSPMQTSNPSSSTVGSQHSESGPTRAMTEANLIQHKLESNIEYDAGRIRLGFSKKRSSIDVNDVDDFGDETVTAESVDVFDDVAFDPAGRDGDVQLSSESQEADDGNVLFNQMEILALKLMFSLFDRSGSLFICYEDLVAYAEETHDTMAIREAAQTLDIVDIDGDGKIGLLDFIHFAARLKAAHEMRMGLEEDNRSEQST